MTADATSVVEGSARPTDDSGRSFTGVRSLALDPARAIFVPALAAFLSLAIVGLPLAIVGWFYPAPVTLLALAIWIPITRVLWRLTDSRRHASALASWLAVGVVVIFTAFTMVNSGEHVLTNRDPGVYVITGRWLAANGNLVYDNGLPSEVTDTLDHPESWSSQGIYADESGIGYFQFQHLTGVVLATSHWLGGDWLLFRVIGIVAGVSLLGLFLLSRRIAGSAFGSIPVVVAAAHPAFVHFAKDAYSEWFAMSFAVAAFLIWLNRKGTGSDWRYLWVGILLGAGTLARIDAWLTAGAFFAGVAYVGMTAGERRPRTRHVWMLTAGVVPLAALGMLDLVTRSRQYMLDLTEEALIPMLLGFAAAMLMMLGVSYLRPGPLERPARLLRSTIPLLSIAILLGGVYGLLIRPQVSQPLLDHSIGRIAAIQEREGLEVDGSRSYEESTLRWMTLYQGHLPVLFGIGAASLAWYVFFRKRSDDRIPILVTLIGVGGVYFYRPFITPEQFWALRRFLPIVLPLAFVFAAWAARFTVRRFADRKGAQLSVAGLLVLALGQSIVVGWPVASVRVEVGVLDGVRRMCDRLPEDAAVLVDRTAWAVLPGIIRLECGVPVASLRDDGVVAQLTEAGYVPVALAAEQCGGDLGALTVPYEFPEGTVSDAPSGPETSQLAYSLSMANGTGSVRSAPVPATAEAAIQVDVSTEWVPEDGSAVIAAFDEYQKGMWLEYQPSGAVELWVMTPAGATGVLVTDNIDDGVERELGGYLDGGTLYAFCGGSLMASEPVPAPPTFQTDPLRINPIQDGDTGNLEFDGSIEVVGAEAADQS
jgi:hypothetical protein